MRAKLIAVCAVVFAAGCAGIDEAPRSGSPGPAATSVASELPLETPRPTATVLPERTLEPSIGPVKVCPSQALLSVSEYITAADAGLGCFADGVDVSIFGWAGVLPDAIGWLAPGIDPDWLALPTRFVSDDKCPTSSEGCGELLRMTVDPESGVRWRQDGRWVVLTGHTGDARADTCRPDPPDSGMSTADARSHCRDSFVLTSVRSATSGLLSGSFARVAIPELNVRVRPSTSSPVLQEPQVDAESKDITFGTASGIDNVYVLDGPVVADGYRWWLVSPMEHRLDGRSLPAPEPDPDRTGWVADGTGKDAWLIPAANPCPPAPVDTADVTLKAASWAIRLACFPGQELTFRGWYEWNGGPTAIFPVARTWADPENVDRLDFRVFPSTLPLPASGQWIEITGMFDHPSTTTCASLDLLGCRATFTATQIAPLGP